MLATASTRLEPWHALERRGCRAGLLFGPLWVTPLLAKDAGRAAWVAQACRTEGLVGESVNRVFPQLGMGQARALAAVCRDMERCAIGGTSLCFCNDCLIAGLSLMPVARLKV